MSLTLLNQKLDKLNEKEKRLRLTYDVRGTNKYQHRYIKDLKEDFKEDLILRYGNKPYGLGWNQDSELETERDGENQDEQEESVPEDEEDLENENVDIMTSAVTNTNNFRPMSGKVTSFAPANRPFSASTIRPMTASSAGGGNNAQKLMFATRPISAISNGGIKKHFMNNQDISESTLLENKSPPSMYKTFQNGEQTEMQVSNINQNMSTRMKANESVFWKNTKKYDIAQTTKQFNTKQLVFEVNHTDPKLISAGDLTFLKEAKISTALEGSKLVAPKDHAFQDIAQSKPRTDKEKFYQSTRVGAYDDDFESQLDAKSSFNQSLSYIQTLRTDFKSNTSDRFFENRPRKLQRPVTANPSIPTTSASNNHNYKQPLETVQEQVFENPRIYFSSLSDLRKKGFFMKLNAIEPAEPGHPSASKELKSVDWTIFKDVCSQKDFHSLHLIIMDLNTFDHMRFELEVTNDGKIHVKDKEELREILDVYGEFIKASRTNISSLIIYYETNTNRMHEVFSRVLVYEKEENEYDVQIWRNIYRYLLHKIILANTGLYSDAKTYQNFSKMIKDIIDDRKDYVSAISSQIQKTKDHPIVVERNGHVYNFDFHSYILECSTFYAQAISKDTQQGEEVSNEKKRQAVKARPASAIDSRTKFTAFSNKQVHNLQENALRDSMSVNNDRINMLSPPRPVSTQSALSTNRQMGYQVGFDKFMTTGSYNSASKGTLPPNKTLEKRSLGSSSSKSLKKPQEKLDMTLQGGRMNIHQDIWAASANTYTQKGPQKMITLSFTPGQKDFSLSAMQTPTEGIYPKDPNLVTVNYNTQPVKKVTNVVINRRPQSAQNKNTQPKGIGVHYAGGFNSFKRFNM